MQCLLCGKPIDAQRERFVPEGSGGHVHLACALRHSHQRQARRQRHALLHAAALGLLLVVAWSIWPTTWVILGLIIGSALHIVLHRRWWWGITERIAPAWRLRRRFRRRRR